MLALILLLSAVPVLWIGQTILLRAAGMPVRWRLSTAGTPPTIRAGCRAVVQMTIIGVIIAYPILSGRPVWDYYRRLFPWGRAAWAGVHGFGMSVLYLSLLYLAWTMADCVRFGIRHKAGRIVRRLVVVPLSAALGAGVEEVLFRGVLLNGLSESLPLVPAVAVATLVFAAAHYVRQVKRFWTIGGHVMLGLCLCLAFVWTHALWLPIGLHAGGIFIIMATRPFLRYEGPAWVTGASIFPFSGVVGVAALGLLTMMGWSYYRAGTP